MKKLANNGQPMATSLCLDKNVRSLGGHLQNRTQHARLTHPSTLLSRCALRWSVLTDQYWRVSIPKFTPLQVCTLITRAPKPNVVWIPAHSPLQVCTQIARAHNPDAGLAHLCALLSRFANRWPEPTREKFRVTHPCAHLSRHNHKWAGPNQPTINFMGCYYFSKS